MKNENNPSLFRKMSEPHESVDALNESLNAFFAGVKELRETHGLLNIVIVVSSPAIHEGAEQSLQGSISFGDELKVPLMLAQALGDAQSEMDRRIERLSDGRGNR